MLVPGHHRVLVLVPRVKVLVSSDPTGTKVLVLVPKAVSSDSYKDQTYFSR